VGTVDQCVKYQTPRVCFKKQNEKTCSVCAEGYFLNTLDNTCNKEVSFEEVLQDKICSNAVVVPTTARRLLQELPAGVAEDGPAAAAWRGPGWHFGFLGTAEKRTKKSQDNAAATAAAAAAAADRLLITAPTPESCYRACSNYFAPNNGNFFSQIYIQGGQSVCGCCTTCESLISSPGAQLFAVCQDTSQDLELESKLNKKKSIAPGQILKFLVKVRNVNDQKQATVKDVGLRIHLPSQVTVVHTLASGALAKGALAKGASDRPFQNSTLVEWRGITLDSQREAKFLVNVRVKQAAPAGTKLTFQVATFKYGIPGSTYCVPPGNINSITVSTNKWGR
jgi:hypothetical protein